MYSRVVKQEQGETGARVVSLAPGIVDTDMQVAIRSSDPAHFPALSVPGIPRHRQAVLARQRGHPHPRLPDRDDFGTAEIDDIRNYD